MSRGKSVLVWIAFIVAGGIAHGAMAASLSSAIVYQGQLKQDGAPVNGMVDLAVSLWDDAGTGSPPAGGTQIGGTQTIADVTVSGGLFTISLNGGGEFRSAAFSGQARWLQLAVNGSTLSPRQPLAMAPFADFSNNTRGLLVDDEGRVTIGNNIPPLNGAGYSFLVNPPELAQSVFLRASGGRTTGSTSGAGGASLSVRAGDDVTALGGLGEGGDVRLTGGLGSANTKGGDVTLTGGRGGSGMSGQAGNGGNIRIFPGEAGLQDGGGVGSNGIMFVMGAVGIGTQTPPTIIPLTLAPTVTDIALLIRPQALKLNQSTSISFIDPDGGTGPMYLRYTDNGSPAIEAVGGPLRAPDFIKTSSARYKHDIEPLPAGILERLLRLRPVSYTWDAEHGGGHDVGLIAEEVAAVLPEAVYQAAGQPEGISYPVLTTVALQALAEQHSSVKALQSENAELRARLERLEKTVERLSHE